MKNNLRQSIKRISGHFAGFAHRTAIFLVMFGGDLIPWFCISAAIIYGLMFLRVDRGVIVLIAKLLLTFVPAIPTYQFDKHKQKGPKEDYSMDLCFIAWIASILVAWCIL